jgi:hypothetical protein
MHLLYKLDTFHLTFPISYYPSSIFPGRTISYINEIFYFSKFWLLIPIHLDESIPKFCKDYVDDQLHSVIGSMIDLVSSFVQFSNSRINSDPTLYFFSKTVFITFLVYCLLGNPDEWVLKRFEEAIRVSGFQQDMRVLRGAVGDKDVAVDALMGLISF